MLHAAAAAAAPGASADFLASGISPWSCVNDRIRFVERQRRALQVNTHLQMYRTRGINFDWLHPSVDTILRGAHFVDIEQLSEPMRSLVAYCRRLEFHLTNTQIASICQEIADAHIRCETRIACVTRTMIEEGMHDEFIFVLERLIRRSMANVGWHLSGRVPVLRECNARPFDLSMPVDVEPSEEAQQCNDQLEFPRSLLEVCFDYVVGSAGGMFMHTPLHVPARASGQVLTAWDVDTCLQDRMRHSVRFSLLCCDVVSSYVDAVDDTLACFSLRVSSRGRRAIALAAARTIDARYDPSTAAAYYPFDIQDGEDDDVFQLFCHARCAPDADISLDSTERRLVARADATHASCVCEASSPEHRVESSEKHGSPSLDAEVAMRMFTRTSMFRDFNAIVWRVLIDSCNNMVCTLYERFQAEQLFNVSREELDCVATSVKECIRQRYRQRWIKRRREMARFIIQTSCLRIIPWIPWTPLNHHFVAHPTLQANVRASLAVLARHGIRGDVAHLVIAKLMRTLQRSQPLLAQNRWDDVYLAYEVYRKHKSL